ncbi:MAG: HNH endonuclease family protein [Quadrisphaera sp.]
MIPSGHRAPFWRAATRVLGTGSLAAAVVLAGTVATTGDDRGAASAAPMTVATQATTTPLAADALATIPVAPKGRFLSSARTRFGKAWADVDGNRCSTREDVLRRDLRDVVMKRGSACGIATGTLVDPYGGAAMRFGPDAASKKQVEVDHVVSLSDAWRSGASAWTPQQRLAFANDPLELVATSRTLNQSATGKGGKDAAGWLPPNAGYRCSYVARQVAVKAAYHLTMTQAEKDVSAAVLAGCPGQRLPLASDRA